MSRARREAAPRTVLVTDARRGSSIAIIRSLGRAGWRVVAADSIARCPGFRSKYAEERVVYPDPAHAPDAFVTAMRSAVADHGVDLLIPVTDETILPLAADRSGFGACRLALPRADALETVLDKAKTVELARRVDVPVPRTAVVVGAGSAAAVAATWRWPIVLKPARSRRVIESGQIESATVAFANSPEELRDRLRAFGVDRSILLQEYCRGVGHGVEVLARDGTILAAFEHRRLAEVPVHGGASALREAVALDPERFERTRRLVAELEWTGLLMAEYKVGEESLLMEINGRVWGSLPLAVLSGMDFPARLARELLDEPPRVDGASVETSYVVGTRSANGGLLVVWAIQVLLGRRRFPYLPSPGRLDAVRRIFGLLRRKQRFDIVSFRDPGPGIHALLALPARLWRKAFPPKREGTER